MDAGAVRGLNTGEVCEPDDDGRDERGAGTLGDMGADCTTPPPGATATGAWHRCNCGEAVPEGGAGEEVPSIAVATLVT